MKSTKQGIDKQVEGLIFRNTQLTILDNGIARSTSNRVAGIFTTISNFKGMAKSSVPPYYLSKDDDKILTSISFTIDRKGKNPLIDSDRLFYPIGMRDEWTGFGFSLNASFLLDMDRDRIVKMDEWNKHLATQTGKRLGKLFSTKVLPRFGVKAYLLLASNNKETNCPEFMNSAIESMRRYLLNENHKLGKEVKREHFCKMDKNGNPKAYLPARVVGSDISPLIDFYPLATLYIRKKEPYLATWQVHFSSLVPLRYEIS